MTAPLRIGSLFSGYGGLDLAVEQVLGAEPAWFCENDPAPAQILSRHWPEVPNLEDATAVDWGQVEPVDIITAGYPCQPFSAAGNRRGASDKRHLWPHVRKAIRHLRPRYVVLENVAGHRTMGFDRVLADLAESGFDAEWTSLRASDVGAPHHRERLFILATPTDTDRTRDKDERHPGRVHPEVASARSGFLPFPDAGTEERERRSAEAPPEGQEPRPTDGGHSPHNWGQYAPAVRRWERLTRPAPAPTITANGRPRLNPRFAEWLMGLPDGHVTGAGISRAAQLRAIGNGVCPQQAAAALTQLLAAEAAAA